MPRFVPRQRKHKVRERELAQNNDSLVDSNQIQILPESKDDKEEKRRKLRAELKAGQSKISSKKQKRLDKYIETKLRKDENLSLLKKLSQSRFDTSLLQSSKNLGKRSHSQFVADTGPANVVAAFGYGQRTGSNDSDLESVDSFELQNQRSFGNSLETGCQIDDHTSKPVIMPGSGLRQPLVVGADGMPMIHTKKKKGKQKFLKEVSWDGFDTASNNDENLSPHAWGGSQSECASSESDINLEGSSKDVSSSSTESNESGSESSQAEDDEEGRGKISPRISAFKSWATQQINQSLGHVPFQGTDYTEAPNTAKVEVIATVPLPEPEKGVIGQNGTYGPDRKIFSVSVTRSREIEESRANLPIVAEEQKIMEAIHNNPCTLVWGTTGSGKTTQVPQFLFEAGYGDLKSTTPGMIGITQPRRVAAVSMAKRVGEELGQYSTRVSYQIRFENTASNSTAIKFMTDGILLREISQDFALSKYSIIVVDEAHERSVNTDILIGMLSRIVDLRTKMASEDSKVKPLKLVIMSATLRVSDFLQNSNLFPTALPPLIQAEGRQFPVTTHFARRTERDYLAEAFRKVSRGHRKLPAGGMLIFLTGQNEIKILLGRLQDCFRSSNRSASALMKVQLSASDGPLEVDDLDLGPTSEMVIEDEDNDDDSLEHDIEDEEFDFDMGEPITASLSVHVLPLYSQLPTKEQLRVFEPAPENSRLIVLATNVAETSLTIPGIRYVFDCGRSKERVYDPSTGVQKFEVNWISKASAEQRAGRAGRTGPGHCYRLYSSAVYERDFVEHADPEILRTPIESVVLQMKKMGLDNVANFPFPTPPEMNSLVKAERLLKNLGALSSIGQVTQLGHSVSIYPLSPRYGKMLAIGSQHDCLPYVIALVSGLSQADVFVHENQLDLKPKVREEDDIYTNEDRLEDTIREQRKKDFNKAQAIFSKHDPASDALKLLSAVCAYSYANDEDAFLEEMFLRPKALKEISQLRKQLTDIIRANHPQSISQYTARLPSPSPKQIKALNQIVAAGFIDQVAIRADLSPTPPILTRGKPKRAIDVAYLTLSAPHILTPKNSVAGEDQAVYIHPSSILARQPPQSLPQYLIYSHLQQSAPSHIQSQQQHPKVRMHPLTAVSATQLSGLAHDTPLISYGKPIGKITVLAGVPERREGWVVPFLRAEGGAAGGMGWPLPARKVVQRREKGGEWVIEKFLT